MALPPIKRQLSSIIQHELEHKDSAAIRRTKIICTLGPSSSDVPSIKALLEAGMNVARLNFSHGDHKAHLQSILNVRKAIQESKKICAILLDNKGPEIRTGKLKDELPVILNKGDILTILCHADIDTFKGDIKTICVDYKNLVNVVEVGKVIKIDDGLIVTTVLKKDVEKGIVIVRVENTAELGQRKGVNLPGTPVDLPSLTERDEKDLIFGATNQVDFVAISFTRSAADVKDVRRVLKTVEGGENIKIISKIENQSGLDNFDEILKEADGVMVARGDLGVEIPIQKVLHAQKMLIRKCNIAGKPVITATQMLESMIKNPRPTRAEATDVANAVFDGTDCVMLSGETAKGAYPVEAVKVMSRICRTAEIAVDNKRFFENMVAFTKKPIERSESIASSAVKASMDLHAGGIVVLSRSGSSAWRVAKYNPVVPIVCLTLEERVARQCLVVRGLQPVIINLQPDIEPFEWGMDYAKKQGWLQSGQEVVLVKGVHGVQGTTNALQIVACP